MKAVVAPGKGPSRGLLRDCTTSPINLFAALHETAPVQLRSVVELIEVLVVAGAGAVVVGAAVVVVNNLHHGGRLGEVGNCTEYCLELTMESNVLTMGTLQLRHGATDIQRSGVEVISNLELDTTNNHVLYRDRNI